MSKKKLTQAERVARLEKRIEELGAEVVLLKSAQIVPYVPYTPPPVCPYAPQPRYGDYGQQPWFYTISGGTTRCPT